ncbi:hypothetical protein AGLY_005840 [Aphis glycines]|uniref:Uncharacterized protein n=1 Tax=Aphis glycines TaxID=307491 RepID=A0A6G0TS21_APHGL|nr:hypothetical protein AGLY_005840 [Aphis glycines]
MKNYKVEQFLTDKFKSSMKNPAFLNLMIVNPKQGNPNINVKTLATRVHTTKSYHNMRWDVDVVIGRCDKGNRRMQEDRSRLLYTNTIIINLLPVIDTNCRTECSSIFFFIEVTLLQSKISPDGYTLDVANTEEIGCITDDIVLATKLEYSNIDLLSKIITSNINHLSSSSKPEIWRIGGDRNDGIKGKGRFFQNCRAMHIF